MMKTEKKTTLPKVVYKNARYDENGFILVELNHPVHGWIPFLASPHDDVPFGRALYEEIRSSGVAIAPYVETDEVRMMNIRRTRMQRLREVDAITTNVLRWDDLIDSEKAAVRDYRQALLDITEQPTFPTSVHWPTPPDVISK